MRKESDVNLENEPFNAEGKTCDRSDVNTEHERNMIVT